MSFEGSASSPTDSRPRPFPEEVAAHPAAPVAQGYDTVQEYYLRFIASPTYHRYALIGRESLWSIFLLGLRPELRALYRGYSCRGTSFPTLVTLVAHAEIRQARALARRWRGGWSRACARRGRPGRTWDGRWYDIPRFAGMRRLPGLPVPDPERAREDGPDNGNGGHEGDRDAEGDGGED